MGFTNVAHVAGGFPALVEGSGPEQAVLKRTALKIGSTSQKSAELKALRIAARSHVIVPPGALRNSTVSQHLALLRKDGLVSPRREVQTISIASEPAREVLKTLDQVFCTPRSATTK